MNSQRFSGKSRCQLQRSHRWSGYWINEWVRELGRKNTLNIWSSGRAIQLKIPTGRMKHRFRSMDRPCKSSWIGAHENFQAREYDAGASPTSSEHGASTNAFWSHDELFKKILKMDAPNINVIVKERHTYRF